MGKKRKDSQEPKPSLLRQAARLFPEGEERERFITALRDPQDFAGAVIYLKEPPSALPFKTIERLAWMPEWVDRVAYGERPGATEMHARGEIYCLDTSSVFAASICLGAIRGGVVLDMCSSPGGKAIFASRGLQPAVLLCNEVIRKRTAQLISNLKRCHIPNASVCSVDPMVLAQQLEGVADLAIVDAPCSGQSLPARGIPQPGCFHPATVKMNASRQKRIIANAAKVVAPGGMLAYMTCTFAKEENEGIAEWLIERFPEFEPVEVESLASHRSRWASFPAYRMFPYDGVGSWSFAVLFRRRGVPADLGARAEQVRAVDARSIVQVQDQEP